MLSCSHARYLLRKRWCSALLIGITCLCCALLPTSGTVGVTFIGLRPLYVIKIIEDSREFLVACVRVLPH